MEFKRLLWLLKISIHLINDLLQIIIQAKPAMQFNNGPDHPMSYNTIDLQNNENNEKVTRVLDFVWLTYLDSGLILFAVLNFPQKLNLRF